MRLSGLVVSVMLLTAVAAVAQQTPATRIRGTVEKVDGPAVTIKTSNGEVKTTLADKVDVFAFAKASYSDIKQGTFIAVGAMPQPDESQKAIQVTIFPESMRGRGEGHRPWDRPGSTMTNATVDNIITNVDGQVATVKYKGGEKKIVITPEASIRTYATSDKAEIKPGTALSAFATKTPEGNLEITRVTLGRDGIVP